MRKGIFPAERCPDFGAEPTELDWNELCVGMMIWQWKEQGEGEAIKAGYKP